MPATSGACNLLRDLKSSSAQWAIVARSSVIVTYGRLWHDFNLCHTHGSWRILVPIQSDPVTATDDENPFALGIYQTVFGNVSPSRYDFAGTAFRGQDKYLSVRVRGY